MAARFTAWSIALVIAMFRQAVRRSVRAAMRLVRADKGNVAVIFAIALVPIIAIIGAAVDYTRANTARSEIQAALDTVALMVSKDVAANPNMTSDQINAAANAYFKALYHNTDAQVPSITATYTPSSGNGSSVQLTANGSMSTDFMKLVGYDTLGIGTSSTATWGNQRMRVAMVLDNTGSMADSNKIGALQSAAKNMIDTLSGYNQQDGDVYISIIPFAKDVNVGSTNYTANWIKWTGTSDSWDANNGSCSTGRSYKTQSACLASGTCSRSGYTSQNSCQSHGGKWTAGVWTASNHSRWNGCVMDRDQDYDISNTAPIANDPNSPSTMFYAEQYSSCPVSLSPMSNDWSALKQKIDDMSPSGGTNQAIGTAWGWQSLSTSNGPIAAPAKVTGYEYQDYLVILSDGLNTQDRWPSYGNGNTQGTCSGKPCIDARQELLCQAIKQQNITIFTIQVNIDNVDPKSQVLEDCATNGNFQMITSANQTAGAFQNVLNQIARLHLSK